MSKDIFAEVKSLAAAGGKPAGRRRESPQDLHRRAAQDLVAKLGPDDGLDPREEAKRRLRDRRETHPGQRHGTHKQEQLLSQVELAVEGALQTAANPILNSLTVREVAKQGGSLAVVVTPQNPDEPLDLHEATEALAQAASMFRREVAAAITRKETPRLSFVVLPAGAEKVGE